MDHLANRYFEALMRVHQIWKRFGYPQKLCGLCVGPQNLSGKLPNVLSPPAHLLETLQLAREDRTYLRVLKQLARTDVLLLDDWVLHGISRAQQRDLMELVDDRYTLRSTIVTSQYPVDKWHQTMEYPTLANAILGDWSTMPTKFS